MIKSDVVPALWAGAASLLIMRGGTMLRLCGVFILGVFLLWFQNDEVRGPRVSVGGTFKF
ncbi:hypothetical protein FPJ26_12975 [Salmonella enterica]|nr:hypothetical protein [Salmonella enterica]